MAGHSKAKATGLRPAVQNMGRKSDMAAPIIFIAGIPASAKSTYGRWLCREKGFLHLDVEEAGALLEAGLQRSWDDIFSCGSVLSFVAAAKAQEKPVAINWGFPPCFLWVAEKLKAAKVQIWWFDGDRQIARRRFIQRAKNRATNAATIEQHIGALDKQMASIESRWPEIKSVFAERMIETVAASEIPLSVIYAEMFPSA
jgi:hypothetical protein